MKKLLLLLSFACMLRGVAQQADSAKQALRNERLIDRALFFEKVSAREDKVGWSVAGGGMLILFITSRVLENSTDDDFDKYVYIVGGTGIGLMAAGGSILLISRHHQKKSGRLLIRAGLVRVAPALPSTLAYGYGIRVIIPISHQQ